VGNGPANRWVATNSGRAQGIKILQQAYLHSEGAFTGPHPASSAHVRVRKEKSRPADSFAPFLFRRG